MHKRFLILTLALAAAAPAVARPGAGSMGVGFIGGVPTGFTAKYLVTKTVAADFGVGVDDGDLNFNLDALVHLDRILNVERGEMPLFVGIGWKLRDETKNLFGMRFIAGAAYFFPEHPLELFVELAPVLRFKPDTGTNFDGGIGMRYYFQMFGGSK